MISASQVRVIVEYTHSDSVVPKARWERLAPINASAQNATFELLGRAFEVAQREEAALFHASLAAFFRGAMISRGDVAQVIALMSDDSHSPPPAT